MASKQSVDTIKKLYIKRIIEFAIENIPQLEEHTLNLFSELLSTRGNYGSLTRKEIANRMDTIIKYIPGACPYTLFVLADLLDIHMKYPTNKTGFLLQDKQFAPQTFEAFQEVGLPV
ncbi:MAG: hypothetical protein B6242_06995 [Anaerolineaceae bacterium 4572_78]|nr:MAG: hypothetical protein B6242_06995 [Anaerolineaceae bacterium 4572_78]